MADNKANPSTNQSNLGEMVGMLRGILRKFLQNGVDDMLPAKVISYDRATKRARVQPMIMVFKTNNETLARAPIASVPVLQIGGGGYVLDMPLNPGDLGFIKANDRDISLFLQSLKEAKPNTNRLHRFSDGIFIPSVLGGYSIDSDDETACVLQTLDRTQKVVIYQDHIKLVSDTQVIVAAPNTHVTGILTVDGKINAGAGMDVTGTIVASVDVWATNAGPHAVSLVHHTHSGVTSGGSNTGQPVVP